MTTHEAAVTQIETLRLHKRYDEGQGQLIVLLHGLNHDASDWRAVIDAIGPNYHCIAFDLLGFGESPHPLDIDYTADEHTVVLDNTLNDLGLDEPFVLVGYSLGGDIALRYAATFPHRVRRLFLLAAPFYPPIEHFPARGFSSRLLQSVLVQWAWGVIARGKQGENAIYAIANGRMRDYARQWLRSDDLPHRWEIMSKNLTNCISAATFVDDLPKLTMPTVFAAGTRDPIVRPAQALLLKRMKPDLEVRHIHGLKADHMLLDRLPKRVGEEILLDESRRLNVPLRMGSGPPLAIFVGLEGAAAWRPVAEFLSEIHDVALIELLGFGESPAPLAARYDMNDHVVAVRAAVRRLWRRRADVVLVGSGLGATIALGTAALMGTGIARVVAFSPACLAPLEAGDTVHSSHAGALLAAREQIEAIVRDERARGFMGEVLERRMIPLSRSVEGTVLATDLAQLAERIRHPVKLVLPTEDADAPREWARRQAVTGHFQLAEPAGPRAFPFAFPELAVAEIDPRLLERIRNISPHRMPRQTARTLAGVVRSLDQRIFLRGVASLLVGLLLISPIPVSAVWAARGFTAWIGYSALTTVLRAAGLRRTEQSGWQAWMLAGLLELAFASLMLFDTRMAVSLFGLLIFAWMVWHAAAYLFAAWKAAATPAPRWILWLKGCMALAIAVTALLAPETGGLLLRWVMGGYFSISGALVVGHRFRSRQRVLRACRGFV